MYIYSAKVLRVVDGDTLDLEVDLGFRTFQRIRVRLHGIDTPETYGVKKGSAEWERGMKAKDFVIAWLDAHAHDDDDDDSWTVEINSVDGEAIGTGKYGRWLAIVRVPCEPPHDDDCKVHVLNDDLVAAGHAERVSY